MKNPFRKEDPIRKQVGSATCLTVRFGMEWGLACAFSVFACLPQMLMAEAPAASADSPTASYSGKIEVTPRGEVQLMTAQSTLYLTGALVPYLKKFAGEIWTVTGSSRAPSELEVTKAVPLKLGKRP